MDYTILAFYKFTSIENPHLEVKKHKKFFENRDVTCRIYISEEGINAQMSAATSDAKAYIEWMKEDPRFADIHFKCDLSSKNVFPRVTVKYREQLCALDQKVDMGKGGEHVSPEKWREMLESDEERILIDVRNNYEWELGRFKGAELPDLETFREFPEYARALKERVDPRKTPVMMYCTGGIRCELYSALMKEEGFDNVYQLDGGVINYGHKEKGKHWEGKLFVFDDRLSAEVDSECGTISKCRFCETETDHYKNCANMDCNDLFFCCDECLPKRKGCCQEACENAERVRPFEEGLEHPFRRLKHG